METAKEEKRGTQCSMCHKPIKGEAHKVPTPPDHWGYGFCARITVCAACARKAS